MCCDTINRGVAYGNGLILMNQADATTVALDAKTGKVVWSVKNGDAAKGETMTAAPMIVKDKVYVGISGGEFGVQGRFTAYNLKDGSLAWKAYSVGPDDQIMVDPNKTTMMGKPIGANSSVSTWQGDQWKTGGGGTWGWYSYDPDLNLVYYGTGNPSTWNPTQRPGDNRWSMTIFARDADSGMAKWVYQMTPHDGNCSVRRETGKEQMVKVRHDEGVANRIGPEPCVGVREGVGRGAYRPAIEPRKLHIPGADGVE